MAVPKLWFLHCCLCCRDLGPHGPNHKHSWKEHLWQLASTTVAPLRVARLGWLPRQANLPIHGGWRTGICHWLWNVTSPIRKAELPQHKAGSPWENWPIPAPSSCLLAIKLAFSVGRSWRLTWCSWKPSEWRRSHLHQPKQNSAGWSENQIPRVQYELMIII